MVDTTSNVMQFQSRNFAFNQLTDIVTAVLHSGVSIERTGSNWKILADHEIPGLDMNRTYGSFREAVLFLEGILLNNDTYKNVITGVAA